MRSKTFVAAMLLAALLPIAGGKGVVVDTIASPETLWP